MDLDGDGRTDILSGSWPGELYFFKGEGKGKVRHEHPNTVAMSPLIADFVLTKGKEKENKKSSVHSDAIQLFAECGVRRIIEYLRIALDETPRIEDATPGLKALLIRAAAAGSFAEVQMRLARLQTQTRDIFNRLLAVR